MTYKESPTEELKSQLTEEVKQEIVAFLNTHGGTIYVGVNDDGTLAPALSESERDATDLKVSNWVYDAFYPIPSGLITHDFNDDGVLVISVKEGNEKPYYLKEKGPRPAGVYKRDGRSKRHATEQEILQMILESRKYSFEADTSDEQELSFRYFFQVCDDNKISHQERTLKSLGLIGKNKKYTNLAWLLSDQSPVVIKFAKYDSNMNFLVKKQFSGSLIKTLDQALEHAESYNTVSDRKSVV